MSERQRFTSGSPYESEFGFSRAIRMDNRVLVAGTAPIPHPGEAVAETAYRQMLRCGQIIVSVLEEAGAAPDDVVRTRMYLTDSADAEEVGRAHREIFGAAVPAATMVVVAGLIDPAWKIEVEAEAVVGSSARPGRLDDETESGRVP
jgi:enamine deaminase RidA (YjgF/YER057c/UK114 family)